MTALDYDLFTQPAQARVTDPQPSHDAAASLTPDILRASQEAVLFVLRQHGPMTDFDLITKYRRYVDLSALPAQSDSGIRTRRKELITLGRVALYGEARLESGRKASVWRALQGNAERAA